MTLYSKIYMLLLILQWLLSRDALKYHSEWFFSFYFILFFLSMIGHSMQYAETIQDIDSNVHPTSTLSSHFVLTADNNKSTNPVKTSILLTTTVSPTTFKTMLTTSSFLPLMQKSPLIQGTFLSTP